MARLMGGAPKLTLRETAHDTPHSSSTSIFNNNSTHVPSMRNAKAGKHTGSDLGSSHELSKQIIMIS